MPRAVAVPPAGLMGLRDRDHQKRSAVLLQRSPDDCLPVAKPRSMDERAPTPATIAQLSMNDLAAARAELAVSRQPRRPNPRDDFLRAPESRSLLVRIGRDDPPLPLGPLRRIEREQSELSLRFSLGAHVPPASSSAARRSAAGQREVRRPAAPPVHVLMAAHHRPRATRVRIPYAPSYVAWTHENRMVAWVVCAGDAGNARAVPTPVPTSGEACSELRRRSDLAALLVVLDALEADLVLAVVPLGFFSAKVAKPDPTPSEIRHAAALVGGSPLRQILSRGASTHAASSPRWLETRMN